jgi:hypothetical protein
MLRFGPEYRSISVPRWPAHWPVTRLAELPPMGGLPMDGYSDPNLKHMSDIFSCIFYNIPLYFKLFISIFNGNLYHYSGNYFLTTAYEIATSFITVKWRHPKLAIGQHATHLAPPCQMKFPAWVKHTETPVCYARKCNSSQHGKT